MNLSKFLPGLAKSSKAEPTEAELDELDAQAKAERIQFHRDNVRNGPRSASHLTDGRIRSIVRRGEAAQVRKQNVKARKDWIRANKDLSRLRGQLEVVAKPGSPLYEAAMRGLFAGYGAVVQEALVLGDTIDDGETLVVALDFDSQEHREMVVQAAIHHYKIATGQVAA